MIYNGDEEKSSSLSIITIYGLITYRDRFLIGKIFALMRCYETKITFV